MIYTISLVVLLVILAGIIAYAGDVLGSAVGRHRLSLFGWRPRRTGQVVGIAAGILIMLTTLIILALAFREATNVLIDAQRAAEELYRLRRQQRELQANITTLEGEIEERTVELEQALADARQARDAETELRRTIGTLQVQADELRLQLATLESLNLELTELNAILRDETERQAQELLLQQRQVEAVAQGQLTYQHGEVIYSGRIAAQDPASIAEALADLVSQANSVALRRGAGDITLSSEQFNSLLEAIAETPGEDLVILLSRGNQVRGAAQLEVQVEWRENTQLLKEGQLIISRQLHLGSREQPLSQESLRSELRQLVGAASDRLIRLGLFEALAPSLGPGSEESFINQLRLLSGPYMIGMVAREPVYVSGPAELEFVILH